MHVSVGAGLGRCRGLPDTAESSRKRERPGAADARANEPRGRLCVADASANEPRGPPCVADALANELRARPCVADAPAHEPRARPCVADAPANELRARPCVADAPAHEPREPPCAADASANELRARPCVADGPASEPREPPCVADALANEPRERPCVADGPANEPRGLRASPTAPPTSLAGLRALATPVKTNLAGQRADERRGSHALVPSVASRVHTVHTSRALGVGCPILDLGRATTWSRQTAAVRTRTPPHGRPSPSFRSPPQIKDRVPDSGRGVDAGRVQTPDGCRRWRVQTLARRYSWIRRRRGGLAATALPAMASRARRTSRSMVS
jgi:hypothetical protein